jgi:transposase
MKSSITTEEAHLRVVVLAGEGMSRRAIARAVGISRNTVKQNLNSQQEQRDNPHSALPTPAKRAARPKKTDAFETRIKELLKRFNGITAQRVFEILKSDDNAYDDGYTAIKTTVRKLRPRPKKTPSRKPATTKPGAMAESDWSPYDIHCTTGADLHIEAFSYTLPLSRRPAYYVTDNYGVHALMAGHVATFQRFNGLAKCCKYDGQKAVAIRWEGRQPIYNLRFLAFCALIECAPGLCAATQTFAPTSNVAS